VTERAYPF